MRHPFVTVPGIGLVSLGMLWSVGSHRLLHAQNLPRGATVTRGPESSWPLDVGWAGGVCTINWFLPQPSLLLLKTLVT